MLDIMFKEPTEEKRPLRVLVYGPPKVGKSHFVATATEVGPLFWLDSEKGASFYDHTDGHGFRVLESLDARDIYKAIDLGNAHVGDNRPIIAIDSMTSIWEEQKDVAEALTAKWTRRKPEDVDRISFRAWGPAKKPLKRMYKAMHSSRCHIVITARGVEKFTQKGNDVVSLGITPEIEKGLPFAVDLICQMGVQVEKGKPAKPGDFWLRIMGGRAPDLPVGTVIRDPSFEKLLVSSKATGAAPTAPKGGLSEQVKQADIEHIKSPGELMSYADEQGWPVGDAKVALGEKFGEFKVASVAEYIEYLGGLYDEE